MNIEEITDFVYEVRTFGITSNDAKFVQITEYLLSELEKEKEKNRILESKNIKLCDDNLELIKQNPYDKKLHYKYVETPKIEPQWYEKEE